MPLNDIRRKRVVVSSRRLNDTGDIADEDTVVDDTVVDEFDVIDDSISIRDFAPTPTGADLVYEAKALVIRRAIREMGMGWYQYQLFLVVAFGWIVDNMWPVVTSLILQPVAIEYRASHPELLSLAQNIGLFVGAVFWSSASDIAGRKQIFNIPFMLVPAFAVPAVLGKGYATTVAMVALWSFGVGGNFAIESALFLEFLPPNRRWLLTSLSMIWALTQLYVNMVGWHFIRKFSCLEREGCVREDNWGWRYVVMVTGGPMFLMWMMRTMVFTVHESPTYLVGVGLDWKAVEIIHAIAKRNNTPTRLTLRDLQACEPAGYVYHYPRAPSIVNSRLLTISVYRVRELFATGRSPGLIIAVWALIGLAYPLYNGFLPYIQATRGVEFGDGSLKVTYRGALAAASLGIPAAVATGYLVHRPRPGGCKGTLALWTVVTGLMLFGSTTATTSKALVGWNCGFSFAGTIMYGVLYSYTSDLFTAKQFGTGSALTALSNRLFGIGAPIIAIYANLETVWPVYVSGSVFVMAGLLALKLPFASGTKPKRERGFFTEPEEEEYR